MSNQATATPVLENPSQLQLLIDQLQVAPGAENDDETVLQKYWRDVYGIAALLDPAAHQHDISDMSITGKNRHRWKRSTNDALTRPRRSGIPRKRRRSRLQEH